MIKDSVVVDQLSKRGGFSDSTLMYTIENKLNEPRVLDKAPDKVKLRKVKEVYVNGVAFEYINFYNSIYNPVNKDDVATLDLRTLGKQVIQCDYEVFVTIKALLLLGITKSPKQASACKKIFMKILMINTEYITKGVMYNALTEEGGEYYEDTICRAIVDACCSDEEKLKFHILQLLSSMPDGRRYYDTIRGLCGTLGIKECDKTIKEYAKKARKEKSFGFTRKDSDIYCVCVSLTEQPKTAEESIRSVIKDKDVAEALVQKFGNLTMPNYVKKVEEYYDAHVMSVVQNNSFESKLSAVGYLLVRGK